MLNIVAPIAGKSYFFDNEKDGFPKQFIEICGKTMLEHFVKNYETVKTPASFKDNSEITSFKSYSKI